MDGLLSTDYVVTKIDIEEMKDGDAIATKLREGHASGGIPWMVILDADGKELVTSDGPEGNVGCPVQPHETAWFLEMVKQTAATLDEESFSLLTGELEGFAKQYRR